MICLKSKKLCVIIFPLQSQKLNKVYHPIHRYADMAQLVEQRIRNAQAVGSSPTISSKTCVNTAFSQAFSFSEMHSKIQYVTKNLTLFYGVRFCSFISFFIKEHLLTIYEFVVLLPSKFPIVFATFSCMESVTCIQPSSKI